MTKKNIAKSPDAARQKYIVLKGIERTGAHMLSLASALLYSLITKRKLVVDWTHLDSSTDAQLFFDLFSSKYVEVQSVSQIHGTTVSPAVWDGRLSSSVLDIHNLKNSVLDQNKIKSMGNTYSIDISKIDYPHDVVVYFDDSFLLQKFIPHMHLLPDDLQITDRSKLLKIIYSKYILLNPQLNVLAEKVAKSRFTKHTIGIHHVAKDSSMGVSLKQYIDAIETYVRDNKCGEVTTVYMSSKNAALKKLIVSKLRLPIVEYPLPNKKTAKVSSSFTLVKFKKNLLRILMLSKCNLLLNNSPFPHCFFAEVFSSGSNIKKILLAPAVKRIRANNVVKYYRQNREKPRSMLSTILSPLSKNKVHDLCVLNNVSLNIFSNQIVGIIGKNGSGKSTLLKILAGILPLDSGKVEVTGSVIYLSGATHGLKDDLTMRDNIYLVGVLHGLSTQDIDKKLNQIVSYTGLVDYLYTPLYQFSSGMKHRLGFSIVLHCVTHKKPDVLLLDEFIGTASDISFQNKVARSISDLINRGSSVLIVTHNLDFVRKNCSKVIYLKNGKIIESSNVKQIIDVYTKDVGVK
ncbi:MAG TPA: ATP-binding cassette domain-containing protein [Acidobacteriota bacterium]|nr:ATP-binding cassette domain-containing protein [Acidobacteriota bacterium]